MSAASDRLIVRDRILMTLLGALAGVAAYALVKILPDIVNNDRLLLFAIAATGGFFAALLAATGPLPYARGALAAAMSALPAAGLLTWASTRYADIESYLETIHAPAAYALIVSVSLPFLIAGLRSDVGWRHYPTLFRESWNIVVRYAAAWLFVAVVWAIVALSDALFGLVGLTIIQDLIEIEWVPFVLTGAVLGLGLAVVVQLSDFISPFLILRFLRLLLPVVLVVTAVFLVALPIRGLSNLFGGLSAAATLLAMAIGIATLITSAIDCDDDEAALALALRASAQLCALTIPVLAGLALYSIWLRVAEYGLSPDRIAAGCAAMVTLGYGLLYSLALLVRRGWMARIRSANSAMALVVIAVAALWLTPLLNPERISARNQIDRFVSGKATVETLDLWFIGKELGVAGTDALDVLADLDHPENDGLAARIEQVKTARTQYGFDATEEGLDEPDLIANIRAKLTVLPAGADLPDQAFQGIPLSGLRARADGCDRTTPQGHNGCVAIVADFLPAEAGEEILMLWIGASGRAELGAMGGAGQADRPLVRFLSGSRAQDLTPDLLDALIETGPAIEPASLLSLQLGTAEVILSPGRR